MAIISSEDNLTMLEMMLQLQVQMETDLLFVTTEKLAFQMWKNNIDLLGFTWFSLYSNFRKYAHPSFLP